MLKYKLNIRDLGNFSIPLSTTFDPVGNKEELVNEKYFERIKENIQLDMVDMEKVVLYPAVWTPGDTLIPAEKIEINLHFRKRLDDNWVVSEGWLTNDEWGWNEKYFADVADYAHGDYDLDKIDDISDLVGFLGFDDNDIKYQKNRVKKSFVRLMYFDGTNSTDKNLLTYSTSFLDSNRLYNRYSLMRNNNDFINYYKGDRVLVADTERENKFTCFEPSAVDEKYNSLRLSSQILLSDKYDQTASSDGFYIYLFKANAPTTIPKNLYLRVEFNHAGYGKTINFTKPHTWDEANGIAHTILYNSGDFPQDYVTDATFVSGGTGGVKFDYEKYNNNLYLPVKIVYREMDKRYYYYFPWDEQVNRVDERKIVLNLWEPKLN